MRRKLVTAVVGVLLVSALALPGAAVGERTVASATTIKVAFNKKLKKPIVVDGAGLTLYMFTVDSGGTSSCTVKLDPICPKLWPVLKTVGTPRAGRGIVASKLATTRRSGGVLQVVYNGHPLYYFSGCCGYGPGDKKPGDLGGQGFFQLWYVLSPKGTPIRKLPR